MCQESVLILLARLGLVCKIDLNRLECLNSSRTASAADMLPRNFDDETLALLYRALHIIIICVTITRNRGRGSSSHYWQ